MIGPVAGRFWRCVFAADAGRVLQGTRAPEGRFHHGGQVVLYMSPEPGFARMAVARYVRPGDAPRVIVALDLRSARLADLRDPAVQRALGLTGAEAGTPWQPERAQGLRATSWQASDAARAFGADGIVYAARSDPRRWHAMLFGWNADAGPQVGIGPVIAF